MARTDTVGALSGVPLFESLSGRERSLVARAARTVAAGAAEELVREGEPGDEFFLILDGTATVRRNGRKVASLGPGDYFGELAILDGARRSATVVADGPATLLVLAGRDLVAALEEAPGLSAKLLVAMAGRLREADRRAFAH